jgi:carboxypeptidase Q
MPRRRSALAALPVLGALALSARAQPVDVEPYRAAVGRLQAAALADSAAYARAAYIGDTFGHRLSGSASLEAALDWILAEMRADGLEGVRGMPVDVPVWIRGEESAALVAPREAPLVMLGLGGSAATPPEGLTAEVLVVGSFDELRARAAEAAGRIVLYDVPFTTYGETVRYRSTGAIEAARVGAVASLIRSVGPVSLRTPHTGAMRYEEGAPRIPAAALALEDAALLRRLQARGGRPVVRLTMGARTEPDARSRNVIGEIRGRERPEEVVLLACHIDSWDVGQGVVDDAGGCAVAWESVRLLHALGLRPRRTVRAVLFTNEENGLRGALAYRDSLGDTVAGHVFAIESDGGVFAPVGVGVTATDAAFAMVEAVEPLILPLLTESEAAETGVTRGGGGADIGPLMRAGVPGAHLNTDAVEYFWVHHTPADTVDKLDPADVQRNVAVMATLAYVLAEMPERLPMGPPAQGSE